MRVAVVGAGITGLSAAHALARRGHGVVVFDRHPAGHRRGSSHGRSRIVRTAYPDPRAAARMALGWSLWRDLERESGRSLLHETGLFYFGPEGSPEVADVAGAVGAAGEPFAWTDGRDVFPALRPDPRRLGVFTPRAGWVAADLALLTLADGVLAAGGEIRRPWTASEADLAGFDAAIVAPGPWASEWLPFPDLRVTRQTVADLPVRVPGPVWIEASDDHVYGFPGDDFGTKIAVHAPGPPDDGGPDLPDPGQLAILREAAARLFGVETPPRSTDVCRYTMTPDEEFRVTPLGPGRWGVTACSGHAFKFGPYLGRALADLVEGRPSDALSGWLA